MDSKSFILAIFVVVLYLFKINNAVLPKWLEKKGLNSGNDISKILVNWIKYLERCLTKISLNLDSDFIE